MIWLLTAVVGKPPWLHVEGRADVEDVGVPSLTQVGDTQLGASGRHAGGRKKYRPGFTLGVPLVDKRKLVSWILCTVRQ